MHSRENASVATVEWTFKVQGGAHQIALKEMHKSCNITYLVSLGCLKLY